jgi:hypothetical protein
MAGVFDMGNIAEEMRQMATGAKTADTQVVKLDKDTQALNKTLERAARAVARTQAASTKVSGVYGTAGTGAYSGYKPKGFTGTGGAGGGGGNLGYAMQTAYQAGQTPASGYQPKGFTGKGKTVDTMSRFLGSLSNSGSTVQKLTKNFFKFQMATLGLAFSFGALESTVIGAVSAIGDLGGTFKSAALGKAFSGVDMMGISGTSNEAIVTAWKNFEGIMGLVSTTLSIITANMLTPEVMAAIGNLFEKLAPVLPDLGEALGDVVIAAADFLVALIPLIPVVTKLIDIFAPWLGVLVPIILILGMLLPLLSAIGYVFAAIELVAPVLAAVLGGVSLAGVALVAVIILVADFIWHLWQNIAEGQDVITAFVNAFWQVVDDIWKALSWLLSPLLRLAGMGEPESPATRSSSASTTNNTTINVYGDADSSTVRKMAKAQNASG